MRAQTTAMKVSLLLGIGLGLSTLGCEGVALENRTASTDRASFPESSRAASRVAELRAAFPLLGEPSPARFREVEGGRVRAEFSGNAMVRVTLPSTLDGWVELEHVPSRLGLRFARIGAGSAPIGLSKGLALYSNENAPVDEIHRVLPASVEDFIAFAERPAVETLSYRVEVTRVAGLRKVSTALEFLDASGTPRLRVAPPYFLDRGGKRHPASLGVDGCRVDTDPRAPWGRPTVAPGAGTCVVSVRWKADDYPILVDPLWSTTDSMSTGRTEIREAPRLPSGRVLVAGGVDDEVPLRLAEIYDPTTGTFADANAMSVPRGSPGITALVSGKILVAGGRSDVDSWNASAEIYDEETGEWSATAGPMSYPREAHSQNLLASGMVLVAGGSADSGFLWSAELFDPATETFDETGPLNGIRSLHTGTVLSDGRVLIAGGESTGTCELYDPTTQLFAQTGEMAGNRAQHAAVSLGSGRALVVGGWDGYVGMNKSLDTAEIYDVNMGTGEFMPITSTMAQARRWPTATVLDSGLVLVVGGTPDGVVGLTSAEVFDPATESFPSATTMTGARLDHAATLLANGSVLVMGGRPNTTTDSALSSASLYMDKSNGSSCGVGDECQSTFCVAGICCESACTASGFTCASGTCEEDTSGAGGESSGGSSGSGTGGANSTGGNAMGGSATGGSATGGSVGAGTSAGGSSGTGGNGSGATGGSSGTGGDGSGATGGSSGTGGNDPGAGGDGSGTACSVDSDCASDHYCNGDVCVPRTPLESACGCSIPGRRVPNAALLAYVLLGAGIVLRRRSRRSVGCL